MSRTSKLTPARHAAIVQMLRDGNYVETACRYVSISKQTFYTWLDRGEKATRGRYRDFYVDVEQARAEAEARNVQVVQKAAHDGTWQAAAWWLERRDPARWGRRVHDVNTTGNVTINMDWGDANPDD